MRLSIVFNKHPGSSFLPSSIRTKTLKSISRPWRKICRLQRSGVCLQSLKKRLRLYPLIYPADFLNTREMRKNQIG